MNLNTRKNSTYIIIGIAVFFTVLLFVQFAQDPDDQYESQEIERREAKDQMFLTSADSPLPDSLKGQFEKLNYFPPNREYRITANFVPNKKFELYEIKQTGKNSKATVYVKSGTITFKIHEREFQLTAFHEQKGSYKNLFIPFKDKTSGNKTYGGGRYLEARLLNDLVRLDFNKVYNPYCVYNLSYVCPIPPEENYIDVEILAGEKNFTWTDAPH